MAVSIFISLVVGSSRLVQAYVFQCTAGNMINTERDDDNGTVHTAVMQIRNTYLKP